MDANLADIILIKKQELDILQVYINGFRLVPDKEYTIISNTQIMLPTDVKAGTPIAFEVFKSIDGSSAETVVQQVTALQQQVNALQEQVNALLQK